MEKTIKNGLISIFSRAKSLVWLQHVRERESKKSDKLFASTSDKKSIRCDICENQKTGSLQLGLADAIDASNFNVKLESLKSVWDSMLPRF